MTQVPTHNYTFVRTDIPLQAQLVQACHSAMQAGALWKGEKLNLVLLQTDSEQSLLDISKFLLENGINHVTFFEPDDDMGHTSITTEPLCSEKRKLLNNFKLWKKAA